MISLTGWGVGNPGTCSEHRKTFKFTENFEFYLKDLIAKDAILYMDKVSPTLNLIK